MSDAELIAAYLRELVDAPVVVSFGDTVGIGSERDDGLVPVAVTRDGNGWWSLLDPDVPGETVATFWGRGAGLVAEVAEAAAQRYQQKLKSR